MTNLELIAKERQEQITKHGYTIEDDKKHNQNGVLLDAAIASIRGVFVDDFPKHWNRDVVRAIVHKPLKERLIIAAAFILAELDRFEN